MSTQDIDRAYAFYRFAVEDRQKLEAALEKARAEEEKRSQEFRQCLAYVSASP